MNTATLVPIALYTQPQETVLMRGTKTGGLLVYNIVCVYYRLEKIDHFFQDRQTNSTVQYSTVNLQDGVSLTNVVT